MSAPWIRDWVGPLKECETGKCYFWCNRVTHLKSTSNQRNRFGFRHQSFASFLRRTERKHNAVRSFITSITTGELWGSRTGFECFSSVSSTHTVAQIGARTARSQEIALLTSSLKKNLLGSKWSLMVWTDGLREDFAEGEKMWPTAFTWVFKTFCQKNFCKC